MKLLPAGATAYRQTGVFDQGSVPAALLNAHTTKANVWGRIKVVEGELLYRILEPALEEIVLSPERDGIVEPQVPHEVRPLGDVRFYVEFLRES